MKKYYEFAFDEACFYDYTDRSKFSVSKMVYGEKIPPHFKKIYLEQLGACLFREIFTKRNYIMIDSDQLVGMGTRPNRRFKPKGVEFVNGRLSKVDVSTVHDRISVLSSEGLSKQYLEMLNSMLIEAPICAKLVTDHQISVKRNYTINKDGETTSAINELGSNPLGYIRMLELRKESEIYGKKSKNQNH